MIDDLTMDNRSVYSNIINGHTKTLDTSYLKVSCPAFISISLKFPMKTKYQMMCIVHDFTVFLLCYHLAVWGSYQFHSIFPVEI